MRTPIGFSPAGVNVAAVFLFDDNRVIVSDDKTR